MSSAAQSWRRLVLAGTALAAAAAGAGVLWPALPDLGGTQAAGPVLQQVQRHGVLHVALRSYARPSLPGEPLPPEPDVYDQALADWLGRQLGTSVKITPASDADLVLEGVALQDGPVAADRQTGGSYMPQSLQLLVLKQQASLWGRHAPATGPPGCRMWRRRPPPDPRPASPRVRPLPAPCRPRACSLFSRHPAFMQSAISWPANAMFWPSLQRSSRACCNRTTGASTPVWATAFAPRIRPMSV